MIRVLSMAVAAAGINAVAMAQGPIRASRVAFGIACIVGAAELVGMLLPRPELER